VVVVAPAEPHHVDALAALLEELDRHYGTTEFEPLEQRVTQIRDALFGPVPAAFALLAWHETDLVGMASYSFLWPAAGVTRSLYLKELYVARNWQRQGIGTLLMANLQTVATQHGCSRLEWTTDRDSQGAQRFYANLGVPVDDGKLFYRIALRDTLTDGI
jgi:GNAT superfamily N-acetyltransferase